MSHRVNIPYALNMSFGFIPIIVSILLCELIKQDMAIYIGTIAGLVYFLFTLLKRKARTPNFILSATAVTLLLFSVIAWLNVDDFPKKWFPVIQEVALAVPLFFLYLCRNNFLRYYQKKKSVCQIQVSESTIVSIRVFLIFVAIHLFIIGASFTFLRNFDNPLMWVLLYLFPIFIFIFSILFNQFGIHFFNRVMSQDRYIPVINERGGVIGKIIETDIAEKKDKMMIPVIRIAVAHNEMLFLSKRSEDNIFNAGKMDIPMETMLYYAETIEDGIKRLLESTFPAESNLKPRFNIKYHFINTEANRLVYLFILNVKDDSILCDPHFLNGKLWTPQQITQNLDMGYFGDCFEQEFEHLETAICTMKKYKVS